MDYVIRAVRAEDWKKAREIRLEALQDPAAPIAFLETYEAAAARSDAFWQERTANAAAGVRVRQFVAEDPDGRWAGTVSVLVERPSDEAVFGEPAVGDQTHVVAVFVRSGHRGRGVIDALLREAVAWSWSLEGPRVERVRLHVHEKNARAAASYRRNGFLPSGHTVPMEGDPTSLELELEIRRQPADG
ncbi:GNAT family N-acetyltransferase [Streptomyces nitrosporeus]|uniref:GNAT family N-acetyltransferase n=1 Tax=Streptomyces nitrosporeus TaxID=28894 RepID=A0A5J6FCQ9_9ACTN|nr:GNAT family N-acetyltransferase [Streptomyces nitrosporeus]QEU73294.1 GNAT family N-acetyltransferase [Streptomyces nitrosporeus]GGZ09160.1 N-acetyltransferase [Streptomyces nitrosporeus]